MPRAYNYSVDLKGYSRPDSATIQAIADRDTYAWMLNEMKVQCQRNKFLTAVPIRRIKDVIYKNGVRESFEFDWETNSYCLQPKEIITKKRISD